MQIIPRHVVCILGHWKDFSNVRATVDAFEDGFNFDEEYSQLTHDSRMTAAFEVSMNTVDSSMTQLDRDNIASHTGVAYVLSPPLLPDKAELISGKTLLLVDASLKAGGVAAKSESAGLAHGRQHWMDLAQKYSSAIEKGDQFKASATLCDAWIKRPFHDELTNSYYSIGMHLLGFRDTEIENSLDPISAIKWIDLMNLYVAADKPTRPIIPGEVFSRNDEGPRWIIQHTSCQRYETDEFFFNPYGYHRLEKSNPDAD